jgi:hypothetical protein
MLNRNGIELALTIPEVVDPGKIHGYQTPFSATAGRLSS